MEVNNRSRSQRPACDNCKDRKTKCDRGSPCSSCVAADLECKLTRQAPEKRQRVLISARYDEAIENVNRSLQDVSLSVQKLLQNSERHEQPPSGSRVPLASNHLLDTAGASEGYNGDSSFQAHVQGVTNAVSTAELSLGLDMGDTNFSATNASQMLQTPNSKDTALNSETYPSPFQIQYPELDGNSLPPLDPVLKILRLVQTEKQRFFMDIPVIDEQQFEEICRKVYFAVSDYSLSAWVIVNTGLYYLFVDLDDRHLSQIGVTGADVQQISRLLSGNLDAAIQSLRLCQDPSIEWCQALALLTTFSLKSGRNAVAWSLTSSASRMCIDLGLHRLPSNTGRETSKKRNIFWHIYVMDKGMAFTLGRTPSIHQYDVSTKLPSLPPEIPGAPYLYFGFVEFALIVGDMHIQLFSAAAQQASPEARVDSAKSFAARLVEVNNDSLQITPVDPMFKHASILLDIIMHCLITIAYRLVPCNEPNSHPLQCSAGCLEAARRALSTIVHGSQTVGQQDLLGWSRFLNMLFSLVPFASFIVLAGNIVASSSAEDLSLLSATVAAIEPMATSSLWGKKLYSICQSFYQFARFVVTRQATFSNQALLSDNAHQGAFPVSLDNPYPATSDHFMTPQDWDTVMNSFDLEIDAGAIASFVEPYLPFGGQFT